MDGSLSSFGTTPSSVLNVAPLPVASSFDPATGNWIVVFDQELQSGEITASGWNIVVLTVGRVVGFPVVVDGNVVNGTSTPGVPVPLPDRIRYNEVQGNLVGANGIDVENFEIVPFVGVPVPEKAEYDVGEAEVLITFSENIFINTATKTDFDVVFIPNTLNVQSMVVDDGNVLNLTILIDGPGDAPSRVEYNGRVNGIEDIDGNDVPLFVIGLTEL